MREGWQRVPLGEVTTQVIDPVLIRDDESYSNLGLRMYAGGVFEREAKRGSEIKASKLFRVREGQFIYNRLFAGGGSFGIVLPEHRHGVVSNEFPVFDLDQDRLMAEYLYMHFQQPSTWETVAEQCIGTTQTRLRWKEDRFRAYSVALPPLAEQRRIVDLIGSLDETIAAAEVVSNALRTSASALASHMWMAGSPERLRDLGQLVTGATPSTKDASSWSSKDVPFVTPAEVPWGGQVFDSRASERFVSESAGASSTRRLDGTGVLQVCIGATVGKVGVTTGPALFNQQINAVFGLSVTDARVLAASMASPQFQTEIKRAAGSSTMPLISKGSWGEMEVRLPDEDSRTQWASMLEGADAAATAHAKSIADLRALRSNLLTALLSGEHEIPATYDELMVGEA